MRHIIITRYNLGKADSTDFDMDATNPNRKKPYVWLDPEWLEFRYWLFAKYLIPALKAQTNKDFTFVVRFNPDTPKEYLDRIKSLYPEMVFCFSSNPLECLWDYNGPIISSRIDSDDCVSKYYVEDIQNTVKQFAIDDITVIIPSKWIDIHHVKKQYVFCDVPVKRQHVYSNPFISLYEPNAPYVTVLERTHHGMWVQYPHIFVWGGRWATNTPEAKPLWMRIMHWRNVANDWLLDNKKLTKEHLEWFDFLGPEVFTYVQ